MVISKIEWIDTNTLIFRADQPYAKNTECTISRKCNKYDELTIALHYLQYTHADSLVELFISNENPKECFSTNKSIYKFTHIRKNNHFYSLNGSCINYQYDIPSENYPIYLRLKRDDKIVKALLSTDFITWNEVSDVILPQEFQLDNLYIGIYSNPGENQYYHWLFSNYIQLCIDTNSQNIYLDYYMFPKRNYSYHHLHQFIEFHYEENILAKTMFGNIHNYLQWNINNNRYIEILLDEYFIPNRDTYQKMHYIHSSLIYGFDDIKKVYYIMGYGLGRKLLVSELHYDLFDKAFNNDSVSQHKSYRYNPNTTKFTFHLEGFKQTLQEYLIGYNSSIHTYNLVPMNSCIYGINIYKQLLTTDKGRKNLCYDVRISYLLYEHNEIMKQRLDFILANNILPTTEFSTFIEKYHEIFELSNILKNLVVKNVIKGGMDMLILKTTKQIEQLEKIFYRELVDYIDSSLSLK